MLFLKRFSDVFDKEKEKVIKYYSDNGRSNEEAHKLSLSPKEYLRSIYVPEVARWSNIKKYKTNINHEIYKILINIEKSFKDFKGVLTTLSRYILNVDDQSFIRFIDSLSNIDLSNYNFETSNSMGYIHRLILEKKAYNEGKFGAEYYTPTEVIKLLILLLKPSKEMKIYDPAVGSGGFLIGALDYLRNSDKKFEDILLYGQEINQDSWAMCQLNMYFNDQNTSNIYLGDSLNNPLHKSQNNSLMKFDRVVSSPPFSLRGKLENPNNLNQFPYGPPPANLDFAFIQHMISSLKKDGKMGAIITKGLLFRGGFERTIRKGIIEDDLIEAIIELPSSLYFGTSIPTLILIINKNKIKERKKNILFINAEYEYEKSKFKNKLRNPDIEKIISIYENWKEEKNYSTIMNIDQIREEDYNIGRIIDKIKFNQKISSIDTDFKNYNQYKLKDLSLNIERLKSSTTTKDAENVLFIPSVGTSNVVIKREDSKLKFNNLYMVRLNNKVVRSKYLNIFFKSDYGKESIKSMYTGGTIPHLDISSLHDIRVGVPSLEVQDRIIETEKKIISIKEKINEIEDKLIINPVDDEQSKIIDNILSSANELSNQVSPLLCEESIIHEFKASFRTPYPNYPNSQVNKNGQIEFLLGKEIFNSKKQVQKYLEFLVMKTIASFLNTRGGTLVIGVHEFANNKEVVGIDREEFDSDDQYQRHFIQQLNNAFSALTVSQYISTEVTKINDISVLVIKCEKTRGKEIIYLNDVVYVRTGPRIDQLSTKEVVDLFKDKLDI